MSEGSLPVPGPYHPTPARMRTTYLAFGLMFCVPLIFALWFFLWGIPLSWGGIGIGALGWMIALVLRNPLALLTRALPSLSKHTTSLMVAFSGPCEELTRLIIVLLLAPTFSLALMIGLGWAAIEVVYSILSGFVLFALLRRDDDKARQARAMLEQMGLSKTLLTTSPLMGVVERIAASATHLGFTLLLAWHPLLVILTIPAHSGLNFIALKLARRSALLTEGVLMLIGILVLSVGLAVFARL